MYLIPDFKSGQILKKEMLEALRNNPQNYIELQYSHYGNGIITGFNINANNEQQKILISPGIAKINDRLVFETEFIEIDIEDGNNYVYLSVCSEILMSGTLVMPKILVKKEEETEGIELFRYTKTEGANLLQYSNFKELYENFTNRIDRRYSPTSVEGGNIVHASIFKIFACDMLNKIGTSIEDMVFSYHCLNNINDVEIVKQYLGTSFGNVEQSIEKLWKCLKEKRNEKREPIEQSEEKEEIEEVICVG